MFLPILPGTDVILFNGLLNHLRREGRARLGVSSTRIRRFRRRVAVAQEIAPFGGGRGRIGLDEHDVARFFDLFAATQYRVVTAFRRA